MVRPASCTARAAAGVGLTTAAASNGYSFLHKVTNGSRRTVERRLGVQIWNIHARACAKQLLNDLAVFYNDGLEFGEKAGGVAD